MSNASDLRRANTEALRRFREKKKTNGFSRVELYLPIEVKNRLQEEAIAANATLSHYLREVITGYATSVREEGNENETR